MKDQKEVLAQALLMKNQMQKILEQSGKAVNLTEMRNMKIIEPNSEDNNRNLLLKTIAAALIAETEKIRAFLPGEAQEQMAREMPARVKDYATKLITRLEKMKPVKDPVTGKMLPPSIGKAISPMDLTAAAIYPELVKQGVLTPKGEVKGMYDGR
jgi:hypothetical protein